jgi:hypothetical protein
MALAMEAKTVQSAAAAKERHHEHWQTMRFERIIGVLSSLGRFLHHGSDGGRRWIGRGVFCR